MLLASGTPVILAQHGTGTIRISGGISPALKLSLGSNLQLPAGVHAVVEAKGRDFIEIGLSGEGQRNQSQMTIPLEIRTNVGYELSLSLLSSSGCVPGMAASITSVRASGEAVVPGAAATSRRTDVMDLVNPSDPLPVLTGPRISARGNFTTVGNALLVHLNITMTERVRTGCSWRASLRISLQQAALF